MALELKGVAKRVGVDMHIYPTDLTLAEEGFNILLGTTLAGKTTLMQLMAGLNRPTAGEIWFDGKNVTSEPVQARKVSMVHQQFINYPNFSVFENIASPLRVAGVGKDEIKQRVGSVAELLRLSPMLDRRPQQLSGGQQQRTALARALVKDADLVLLDEPLANLDYKLREELRDEFPRLFANRKCTVVYATTEPSEALLIGGHTAALHEGRVTQFGLTGDSYRKPGDLRTAKVFSDPPMNTVSVHKVGDQVQLADGITWPAADQLRGKPDGTYTLGIRPHHVTPLSHAPSSVSVKGKVLVTELSGSESIVHFDFSGGTWVSQAHGIHAYDVGDEAEMFLDPATAFYFDSEDRLIAA
ncbi:MAG: ABC transporter ATP-binding protein [Pseudomonadota bacterium]